MNKVQFDCTDHTSITLMKSGGPKRESSASKPLRLNLSQWVNVTASAAVLIFSIGGAGSVLAQNVIAWGSGSVTTNVPASATNVIGISAGKDHSLVLRSDGSVVAWGSSANGKTTVPGAATNVVAVAAGGDH